MQRKKKKETKPKLRRDRDTVFSFLTIIQFRRINRHHSSPQFSPCHRIGQGHGTVSLPTS